MSVLDTHHWHFYLSPAETWDAVYKDCVEAKKSILIEQYIFENDEIGQKFLRLLADKAKAGLDVRILCDAVGSSSLINSSLIEELRANGGRFNFYNSLKFLHFMKPRRLFPRTHVKVMMIDAEIAYVGGICIAQRMANWRDTQIRITGPVVRKIKEILECNFAGVRHSEIKGNASNSDFSYIQSAPKFFRHPIYKALLQAIDRAKDYVYISMGFFVPTRRLRRFLRRAASRGVKIVLLIPERSDNYLADLACLSFAAKLLKAGIRIMRYQPTILHNKTVVIDGVWGTVGSSNMDSLSLFHNREANLIIENKEALAEMEKDFLQDLHNSQELTIDFLKQMPLWKKSAIRLARLFRFFL